MDLVKAIQELLQERKRLDSIIARLETSLKEEKAARPARRRGRKQMSAEERRRVAERMRQYWAKRRAEKAD